MHGANMNIANKVLRTGWK